MRTNMSELSARNIPKMIRIITKEIVKFDNFRPALFHAERVTEMKAVICMAESLIADAKIDSSRTWVAERWLNKALPRFQMLRAEVEMQEPVLAHRMAEIPVMNMAAQMSGSAN